VDAWARAETLEENERVSAETAIGEGDLFAVELLLEAARARVEARRTTSRERFRCELRERVRGHALPEASSAELLDVLFAALRLDADVVASSSWARTITAGEVGPYNPDALAARLFARLDGLAPSYLRALVADLEELAVRRRDAQAAAPPRGAPRRPHGR
jgi:hypothetical protein